MRRLSHHTRNRRGWNARPRPDARREPYLHRRRHPADDARLTSRLGRRSADDQARQQHADCDADRRRAACCLGLPGQPEMSAEPVPTETIDRDLTPETLESRLAVVWGTEPGLIGWVSTVDHKMIGRRYIGTAFFFLLLGGA